MDFSQHTYSSVKQFIIDVRTIDIREPQVFNEKINKIVAHYLIQDEFKNELNEFINTALSQAFFVNAFCEYGINSNRGFFPELSRRIKHKLLPKKVVENELSFFIEFLFDNPNDYKWLQQVSDENWNSLCSLIKTDVKQNNPHLLKSQIDNALVILSHRLTNIGIDPFLVEKMPEIDDVNSPFFELNQLVATFVTPKPTNIVLVETLLLHLKKLRDFFSNIQSKKNENGVSLHLTFITERALQHIKRMELLLLITNSDSKEETKKLHLELIKELVTAEQTKNNVLLFIKENTQSVSSRIISHTSQKGEHYIGFSKSENIHLFKSAMGGGLVVVCLVFIKHLIHHLHLSLFFEGLLFGLNYGIGFVFMHLTHLTLATKQPSMTASYIAESIAKPNDASYKPWTIFNQIIRSQFISLIGNLIIVLPLCFFIAWLFNNYANYSIFNFTEGRSQMVSNHPFYSASLIYACITGFLLSLSGIIIGLIDNKTVYSEIATRLIHHPKLMTKYSLEKRNGIGKFVEKNLGAIIGNLFLGFSLGMAGNLGKFIGLPFDIRHITISAGNFGISLGSDHTYATSFVITVFIGVILIGIINIIVSFLISFSLACRSIGLSLKQSFKVLIGLNAK